MWMELQIFGFRALWSPFYLIFVLALTVLYYVLTGPWRKKFGDFEKPTAKQQWSFYLGMLLLYIVKGSPVDLVSHIMFTGHMIQMALYYLVFPVLMFIGIPEWIWKKIMYAPIIGGILRFFTKPLLAIILFNGLFSLYHLPVVFDYAKANPIVHTTMTTAILFGAFAMWWSVFAPVKELDRLTPIMKIGYIFANGVLLTPACGLIIFADIPLYATYTETGAWVTALSLCVPMDVLGGLSLSGPEIFSPLSLIDDQQLGGIVMKITQEIVFGAFISTIFFGWFNKERNTIDPLPSQS